MTKSAQVYKRWDRYFLQPFSRATTGLWIATPPMVCLATDDSVEKVGQAVRDALNASRHDVPLPSAEDDPAGPLLSLAGAKSWARFMERSKCVLVDDEEARLTLMPSRKLRRPKGALESILEKAIVLPSDALASQIGGAIDEAMSRCE